MNSTLKFILTILMPVAATLLFALLERYTNFGRLSKPLRNLIIGAVFAVSAVFAFSRYDEHAGAFAAVFIEDDAGACASGLFHELSE